MEKLMDVTDSSNFTTISIAFRYMQTDTQAIKQYYTKFTTSRFNLVRSLIEQQTCKNISVTTRYKMKTFYNIDYL